MSCAKIMNSKPLESRKENNKVYPHSLTHSLVSNDISFDMSMAFVRRCLISSLAICPAHSLSVCTVGICAGHIRRGRRNVKKTILIYLINC